MNRKRRRAADRAKAMAKRHPVEIPEPRDLASVLAVYDCDAEAVFSWLDLVAAS